MKSKRRKKGPSLEELIPDKARREEVVKRLYSGDDILGEGGIFTDMLQALVNAALDGEMDETLSNKGSTNSNRRNGYTDKKVRSKSGPIKVQTPRDRQGEHEPIIIKKWERELSSGMDDVILSLYARGQSVEDVRHQLRTLYGVDVSAGIISSVTNRIWTEVLDWQQRPLHSCYPIIYLDAIHYKVRESGQVSTRAVYTCYGIDCEGQRDVLGLYLDESEGARSWGLLLEDLKRRGVEDVFIFCIDGLRGFKEAIGYVYPEAIVQRCIVHMVRSSTRFTSYKDIKKVCSDLRKVYTSANRKQAEMALESFGKTWNDKYPEIQRKWLESWEELMSFMDYESNIRRMIYTTNPVEVLHRLMRKITKTKGAWTSEKALTKQLYLALKYNEKSWKKKARSWPPIQRELLNKFEGRYEKHLK